VSRLIQILFAALNSQQMKNNYNFKPQQRTKYISVCYIAQLC